jgi:excisionase family DNA binding protein
MFDAGTSLALYRYDQMRHVVEYEDRRSRVREPRPDTAVNDGLIELYLRLDPVERRRIFLNTRAAARDIGVAQRTLQTWIAEGRLAAVRVGGRYLVHAPSLETVVRHAVDY